MSENNLSLITFEGTPCRKCGSTIRYLKRKRCVSCRAEYEAKYRTTPKGIARKLSYDARPEVKAHRIAYSARPETKARLAKWHLIRAYGITVEEYNRMFFLQNECCAICSIKLLRNRTTHVDHDHKTGKIRGLLCESCNQALGLFRDDPQRCRNAATYIESSIW
jgi:hypothetical protein